MIQLGQEERHELVHVLDVVAQRRKLHRAREELQQAGQIGLDRTLAEGHRNPELLLPARGQRLLQRDPQRTQPHRAEAVDVPDDQAPLALEQFAERPHQPLVVSCVGGVQHVQGTGWVAAPVHGLDQRQLAGSRLPLQREPLMPRVGLVHLIAPAQPERSGADQAGQEPAWLRPSIRGRLDQFRVRDAAGEVPLALAADGPAGHPRPGAGRQLDIHRAKLAAGQRLGRTPEYRCLVARVEDVPGVVAHHHHVLVEREDDPGAVPAGPQVLLQQLNLPPAGVVEQRLRYLAGGALGERDQQRVGVLAPAGQVHHADDLAGEGVADRSRGAGEVLQMLGVVLMAEHVRRLAALQRRADAVGADALLGIAEARQYLNAVEVPLKITISRQPGEQDPARIRQDDADRLALEVVTQILQYRQGVAAQRGVQIGLADVGQVEVVGGDVPRLGAPPRRQDGVAHLAGLDRLRGQETLPGPGQLRIARHLWPDGWSARHTSPCVPLPLTRARSSPRGAGGLRRALSVNGWRKRKHNRALTCLKSGPSPPARGAAPADPAGPGPAARS